MTHADAWQPSAHTVGGIDTLGGEFDIHLRNNDSNGRYLQYVTDSRAALVNDILDISKIEAGQLEIQPEPASLAALIGTVVSNFSDSATSKGLSLHKNVDPLLAPRLMFDPLRLRQILFNLVGNALKFTAKGQIDIRAHLAQDKGLTQLLRIEVEDSGIGIRPEDQARLFQSFVQAEADTTRRFGGTGLGLVISRRLAELMGGTLALASQPGRGTTVTLTLEFPVVVDVDAEAGVIPKRLKTPVAAGVARRSAARVLVAEDNEVNQLVLQRQLTALGYEADFADDGAQALDRWRTGRYALVLCDCQMPVMDGYTFARRVREAEAQDRLRRKTPIVACTANAMREDAEACYAAGMDDVLTKPLELAALKRMLAAWIPDEERTRSGGG
jgi:CheY-like chemotaxis protein